MTSEGHIYVMSKKLLICLIVDQESRFPITSSYSSKPFFRVILLYQRKTGHCFFVIVLTQRLHNITESYSDFIGETNLYSLK